MKNMNPVIGSSEDAFSDWLVRILARAADCTPVPAMSMLMSPAISLLSMSLAFGFTLTMILAAYWCTAGSMAGFQFGFFTSTHCLLSVALCSMYGPLETKWSW